MCVADSIDELVDWQLGRRGGGPTVTRRLLDVFVDSHSEWPPLGWCVVCNPYANELNGAFPAGWFPLPPP